MRVCTHCAPQAPSAALLSRFRESLAYFIPGCLLVVVSPLDVGGIYASEGMSAHCVSEA